MKKTICFAIMVVMAFVSASMALPVSSYQGGAWEGTTSYNDSGISMLIKYAVYDTVNFENEFIGTDGFDHPDADKQFVYAYQIFTSSVSEAVKSFTILGADGEFAEASSTTSQDDNTGGTEGVAIAEGAWAFVGNSLEKGVKSWYLLFASDSAPVMSEFKVDPVAGNVPFKSVPEPASMCLLGLGGLLLRRKK